MTSNVREDQRILGSLRTADGVGVVRIQDRFDTGIDDMWSALTDPRRLSRWLGDVEGELRLGGEFRARFFASGWEGTGRVDECEPPRRFKVTTKEQDQDELVTEVTLTADGDQTVLVAEERGMPLDQLANFGAGDQIHIEDLGDYIAGRERRTDMKERWEELRPAYQAMAAKAV